MTKTFIMGNLTGNPDYRTTQSGNCICNISVACSRKFTSNGQQQEEKVGRGETNASKT